MDKITLGQAIGAIVSIITSISVIVGFFIGIYNFVKKKTTDRIDKNSKDIVELQKEVGVLKSEIQDDKEERIILLQGLLACLKGLQEQGCDGAVSNSITEIENYLMKKSHV